jgi:citrate lyase subunit beta/citryl-CoA lyase
MTPRSYLFVPGDRPERFAKALASGADAVILDLEDGVAANAKERARENVAHWLAGAAVTAWLRVDVAAGALDDELRLASHAAVAGVVVPKAEDEHALAALAARLRGKALVPMIESARGLDRARAIAAVPGVERLAFGSFDFAFDLSLAHDDEALDPYRAALVLASRLGGCGAPVAGVTTVLDDAAIVRRDALHARRLGFAGKLCIHPRQVAAVNESFVPGADEIAWARRVVEAIARTGQGAVRVDGAMVDRPVVLRAEAILARAGRDA